MRIVVEAPFASGAVRPIKAFSVTRKCGHREVVTGRDATSKRLYRLIQTPCDDCAEQYYEDEAALAERLAD